MQAARSGKEKIIMNVSDIFDKPDPEFNEPRAFRLLTNALHFSVGAGMMSKHDLEYTLQILQDRYFSGYANGLEDAPHCTPSKKVPREESPF